jgi:hypothetical protein
MTPSRTGDQRTFDLQLEVVRLGSAGGHQPLRFGADLRIAPVTVTTHQPCTKQIESSSQFLSSPWLIYASIVNLRVFLIDLAQQSNKLTGASVGDATLHGSSGGDQHQTKPKMKGNYCGHDRAMIADKSSLTAQAS